MKPLQFLVILAAVLFAVFVLLPPDSDVAPPGDVRGLPWQIEPVPGGGSRVFGLELSRSTFDDARARYGDAMKMGIVAAREEAGTLEAYYDNVTAGVILGRMILVGDMDTQAIARLRGRSVDRSHMNETTFRYALHPDDVPEALRARITAITFIPAADIDADTVVKRFGEPVERVRVNAQVEHFLYPGRGLDLVLDDDGKEVLQYVAPRDFGRLREPLTSTGTVKTGE